MDPGNSTDGTWSKCRSTSSNKHLSMKSQQGNPAGWYSVANRNAFFLVDICETNAIALTFSSRRNQNLPNTADMRYFIQWHNCRQNQIFSKGHSKHIADGQIIPKKRFCKESKSRVRPKSRSNCSLAPTWEIFDPPIFFRQDSGHLSNGENSQEDGKICVDNALLDDQPTTRMPLPKNLAFPSNTPENFWKHHTPVPFSKHCSNNFHPSSPHKRRRSTYTWRKESLCQKNLLAILPIFFRIFCRTRWNDRLLSNFYHAGWGHAARKDFQRHDRIIR